jgi:hypothetical protein
MPAARASGRRAQAPPGRGGCLGPVRRPGFQLEVQCAAGSQAVEFKDSESFADYPITYICYSSSCRSVGPRAGRSGPPLSESGPPVVTVVTGTRRRAVGSASGSRLQLPRPAAIPADAAAGLRVSHGGPGPGLRRSRVPDGRHCGCGAYRDQPSGLARIEP